MNPTLGNQFKMTELSTHPLFKKKWTDSIPRTQEAANFINYLWPVSLPYSSHLTPIFLTELAEIKSLNMNDHWVVRDGLVPLLWFFKANPTPRGLKTRLYFAEEFAPFIPNEWRRASGTYRVGTRATSERQIETLILSTIVMDTFCSLEHLEKAVDDVVHLVGAEQLQKCKILTFTPCKFDGFGNEYMSEFPPKFMIKLCEGLGTKINPIGWPDIEAMSTLKGIHVFEFNENFLCADSFMVHKLLGKGASLLFEEPASLKPRKNERFMALSPYHGFVLCDEIKGESIFQNRKSSEEDLAKFQNLMERAFRSETNQRMPWPQWFVQWTKALL